MFFALHSKSKELLIKLMTEQRHFSLVIKTVFSRSNIRVSLIYFSVWNRQKARNKVSELHNLVKFNK